MLSANITSEWVCIRPYLPEIIGNKNGNVLTVLYSILDVFIVIVNTILIIVLVKMKGKKFSNTSKLLIFLSCVDLLLALILLPYQIYMINTSPRTTCTDVGFLSFFGAFLPTLSGETIAFVTADRYFLITHKLMHRTYFSSNRFAFYLLFMVGISSGWGVANYFISQQTNLKKIAHLYISFVIYDAILLIMCIVLNVKILQTVVKALRNSTLSRSNKRTERRLSRTIIIISTILVLCYIPSIIGLANASYWLYNNNNIKEIHSAFVTVYWTFLFVYLNSALNSCVYLLRNERIRKLFSACFRTQDSSEKSSLGTSTRTKKISLSTLVSGTIKTSKMRNKSLSEASETLEIKRGVLVRKQKTIKQKIIEEKRRTISGNDNFAMELEQ